MQTLWEGCLKKKPPVDGKKRYIATSNGKSGRLAKHINKSTLYIKACCIMVKELVLLVNIRRGSCSNSKSNSEFEMTC